MNEYVKSLIIENASLTVTPELMKLRNEYREAGIPTILTESLNFLVQSAVMIKAKRILEFGTSVGCSGIALLQALKDAELYTVERYRPAEDLATENFKKFGLSDRTHCLFGEATEIADGLDGEFDFIFLDCNKSKYKDLLPKVKGKLKSGGVIFADNVLFRGYVSGEVKTPHRHNTIKNNMREFLRLISTDEDFITNVIEVGDGVSVSLKK